MVMSKRFVRYRFVTDKGEIYPANYDEIKTDAEALAAARVIAEDLPRMCSKWCTPCKVFEVTETMEERNGD